MRSYALSGCEMFCLKDNAKLVKLTSNEGFPRLSKLLV